MYSPLGSDVEDFEFSLAQLLANRRAFLKRQARIERRCSDAASRQGVALILHECDQRRHDESEAVEDLHGHGHRMSGASLACPVLGNMLRTRAGTWKQSDLPPPVGIRHKVFSPSTNRRWMTCEPASARDVSVACTRYSVPALARLGSRRIPTHRAGGCVRLP